ncbi:M48 family metallopeptidase [Massilia endophytica]|uniref:M48 family metallopeptidase n=1 Tax=Massilia endophytica TaxID=2899220 RepID=UPI001E5D2546|nr:M48 family metallopeptidase [Massilia endophytica]UGQ49289.1 M48 family metallopeptidase [Massilia endophytica]
MEEAVSGRYFDGKTSRAHRAVLSVKGGEAWLEGEVERRDAMATLRVSERSQRAARKITYPDDSYFEADEQAALNTLLAASGHRDGAVVKAQQSWRLVLGALAATIAVLALGYRYALPAAADSIARALPESVERQMGQGVLALLDKNVFRPSRLSGERRRGIAEAFAALRPPRGESPAYRLLFRQSRVGPNAFALPSGDIVLTDEMVELLDNDQAVLAVLAHELGHLHERHMSRRLIQSSAVAAVTALMFGDASGFVASLPAVALDMHYSRDAETEADDYAAVMLRHNGRPLSDMEAVFAALEKVDRGFGVPYLNSHPPSAERLQRLRNMAQPSLP